MIGFKTEKRLMQGKSTAECFLMEHSALLLTCIKLPHGFKTIVLSIFEWPLKTGFTVYSNAHQLTLIMGANTRNPGQTAYRPYSLQYRLPNYSNRSASR